MAYFLSNIPVLIISALVMAGLCLVMILCAEKNEAGRDINQERCNGRCGSCGNYDLCAKPEKQQIR